MNVEAEIVSYLGGLGFSAYGDVPASRPAEFVTVERTAGGATGTRFLDSPSVVVRSWAPTRLAAAELAGEVDSAMLAMADAVGEVRSVARDSLYNYPAESGPRYQAVYDLVVHS